MHGVLCCRWFEQDFSGRVNSTKAWDKEVEAVVSCAEPLLHRLHCYSLAHQKTLMA
jgi:hypothetical protein